MSDKCIATLQYKLNRRIDDLNRRVSAKAGNLEVEEFRASIRDALKLSNNIEGFASFLVQREKLGLIDDITKRKEFDVILKQCELILTGNDEILLQAIKNKKNRRISPYSWDERQRILNEREAENRRSFRAPGYSASRAS